MPFRVALRTLLAAAAADGSVRSAAAAAPSFAGSPAHDLGNERAVGCVARHPLLDALKPKHAPRPDLANLHRAVADGRRGGVEDGGRAEAQLRVVPVLISLRDLGGVPARPRLRPQAHQVRVVDGELGAGGDATGADAHAERRSKRGCSNGSSLQLARQPAWRARWPSVAQYRFDDAPRFSGTRSSSPSSAPHAE